MYRLGPCIPFILGAGGEGGRGWLKIQKGCAYGNLFKNHIGTFIGNVLMWKKGISGLLS